ncbi:MAG: hypothetical protein IPH10_10250 [bacterium]|nr:hypothetical protein [bacterium]
MTVETIRLRAAGYVSRNEQPDNAFLWSADQIRRTRDKLRENGLLRFYQMSARAIYYGSWRISQKEFEQLMAEVSVKRSWRRQTADRIETQKAKIEEVLNTRDAAQRAQSLTQFKTKLDRAEKRHEVAARKLPYNYVLIPGLDNPVEVTHANSSRITFMNGHILAHAESVWMQNFAANVQDKPDHYVHFKYKGIPYIIETSKLSLFSQNSI